MKKNKKTVKQKSLRYNKDKPSADELYPKFLLGMMEVITAARRKYPRANWCKETPLSTPYASAMRHIMAFWGGENNDKESGNHHILMAAINLMFMYYHFEENPQSDDRIFKARGKKK